MSWAEGGVKGGGGNFLCPLRKQGGGAPTLSVRAHCSRVRGVEEVQKVSGVPSEPLRVPFVGLLANCVLAGVGARGER